MDLLLGTATTAAVAAADCTAFELFGECKIIAKLGDKEFVTLYEEYPDGTYLPAVNKDGVGIVLSQKQPSAIIAGYGNYKIAKTVTATAIDIGVVK